MILATHKDICLHQNKAKDSTSQGPQDTIMKPENIREVCPVCGSSELYLEAGGYTGKLYRCKSCDYMGALIVEADEEMARAIREDYRQKKIAGDQGDG